MTVRTVQCAQVGAGDASAATPSDIIYRSCANEHAFQAAVAVWVSFREQGRGTDAAGGFSTFAPRLWHIPTTVRVMWASHSTAIYVVHATSASVMRERMVTERRKPVDKALSGGVNKADF